MYVNVYIIFDEQSIYAGDIFRGQTCYIWILRQKLVDVVTENRFDYVNLRKKKHFAKDFSNSFQFFFQLFGIEYWKSIGYIKRKLYLGGKGEEKLV